MIHRRLSLISAAAIAVMSLSGCVQNSPAGTDSPKITVTSTAGGCAVSETSAPTGRLVFTVTNAGDQATEFYVLADDGVRVVGEVENIGPGTSRDLVVNAAPGTYFTACKPGMIGDGVGKAKFTVTR